jgi:hypothetical protein
MFHILEARLKNRSPIPDSRANVYSNQSVQSKRNKESIEDRVPHNRDNSDFNSIRSPESGTVGRCNFQLFPLIINRLII